MAARTRVNGDRRKEKNTTTYQEINAAARSTQDESKVRYTAKTHTSETTNMKDQNYAATKTPEIRLAKRSPECWQVTFDHPALNIFGPEMLPQVNEIISVIETDERVKLVVFDSAVEGFFLIHLDFLAKLDDLAHLPPGPTGLHPWPEMLVRLSRASVVSIALIRGRATGMGSELALACDMRFASREKAILSQFEVGAGLVPGGGPMARLSRVMGRGRALEVMRGRRVMGVGRALRLRESFVAGCRS
jgi:enoyl-CoA hydratase/carnithine racemase